MSNVLKLVLTSWKHPPGFLQLMLGLLYVFLFCSGSKRSKQENLKEMGDVSSGMASTVIQLYLREILGSFLHTSTIVRTSAMKVIQLVLAQGLVHPVQVNNKHQSF